MSIRVPNLRRLGGAAAAVAVLAAVTLTASPAAAAGDGYVRLAHLSPDTPAVDVYLKSDVRRGQGTDVPRRRLWRHVGVSAAPGRHLLGRDAQGRRRPEHQAGAHHPGHRRGRRAPTRSPVSAATPTWACACSSDDLKLPDPGQSKVRIIQASVRAPVLDVDVNNGPTIADGVQFATTTDYREVKPGMWTVKVQPSGGGKSSTLPCTLGAGSVYSLLVLDAKGGGLKTELHIDAGRQGTVPLGGVATGDGGTQPGSPMPMALLIAAIAAVLTGGPSVAIRRRSAAG